MIEGVTLASTVATCRQARSSTFSWFPALWSSRFPSPNTWEAALTAVSTSKASVLLPSADSSMEDWLLELLDP